DRRIPNKQILIDEIAAWEHDRNANHTKADWQFTTKNALAMDLLVGCALRDCPPDRCLIDLFRELLDIDIESNRWLSPHWEAQKFAATTIALFPTIRTRELARLLSIQPSTISRWRNSSDFKAMIEQAAQESTARGKHTASDANLPELSLNDPFVKRVL